MADLDILRVESTRVVDQAAKLLPLYQMPTYLKKILNLTKALLSKSIHLQFPTLLSP